MSAPSYVAVRTPAYLSGIYVTVLGESHGGIVLVHKLPSQATDDGRVEMVTERDFLGKQAEIRVTYGAVNILGLVVIARRELQGSKTGIHGEMQEWFRRQGAEVIDS